MILKGLSSYFEKHARLPTISKGLIDNLSVEGYWVTGTCGDLTVLLTYLVSLISIFIIFLILAQTLF